MVSKEPSSLPCKILASPGRTQPVYLDKSTSDKFIVFNAISVVSGLAFLEKSSRQSGCMSLSPGGRRLRMLPCRFLDFLSASSVSG